MRSTPARPHPVLAPSPESSGPESAPASDQELPPARRPRRRHLLIAASLTLLLVAALVLPPLLNISRYQRRISASLTASLGHPVEVSGIRLQLLPRPGVQIANFVVDSTAGYSAEPILQCSSVTAAFRIFSLWRGRLEIARISLDEPSLNLERAPDGEWNFASVLLQASRALQAPTGLARGQSRFPYIEASNARINFKYGNEKLPFSFLNADVSIWLENPHQWQLRFTAQPVRTDINLSLADTGQVQVSGSVDRASTANELPLNLQAEWRGAPLGQVTRMLVAHDLGWRGDTRLAAHITGVPNALGIQLSAAATDFHRETFEPAHPLNLHVTCTATYRRALAFLDALHCLSPIGTGNLALVGTVQQIDATNPLPDLNLVATRVPAGEVLDLLRHTRGRIDTDMTLSGVIDGQLTYAPPPIPPRPQIPNPHIAGASHIVAGADRVVAGGALLATNLLVRSDGMEQPLPDLRFAVQTATPLMQPVALVLEPAHIDLDGPQPLVATARLTWQGYQLHYSGTALLQRLLPLARAFNVVPAAFQGLQGNGTADYNLGLHGDWLLPPANSTAASLPKPLSNLDQAAAPLSVVSGSIALHNADFQPSYLAEPVHIVTATATISPAELRWSGVTATLGATHFTGNLRIPLPCLAACERQFDLAAANVNFGALAASLRGEDQGMVQELINRVRSRSQDWPLLDGSIHISRLVLGRLEVANASADLTLRDGTLEMRSLDGRTLGGALHATGAVDLGSAPSYDAAVQLRRVSAPELAQLLKEHWGPGTIDLSSDLAMRGATASALSGSAKGTLHWSWNSGALPELTTTPLHRFDRWSGNGKVAKGALTITSSEVTSNSTTAIVTGSIGSDRSLDLKVAATPPKDTAQTETAATTASATTMTGTLAAPVVETQ